MRYQSLDDLRLDLEPLLLELRRERSATLQTDAARLMEDSRLEDACSLLNQAIDLDPANTAAREIRNVVQHGLRRQALRPRIDALVAKATQSIAERRYTDAVQEVDAALRLDPENTSLQARALAAQEQRDRSRDANRLRAEAPRPCPRRFEIGEAKGLRGDRRQAGKRRGSRTT